MRRPLLIDELEASAAQSVAMRRGTSRCPHVRDEFRQVEPGRASATELGRQLIRRRR